jgi:hypothetical protein
MKISLAKIRIENFKGLKLFETTFDPERTIIKAENGIGKTTVFDAFLWVLFGKDSTGRKDFELRPLDIDNQPIKGLVTAVTVWAVIDGAEHCFRKEHHEKIVKDQLRGYETMCWIDEVPKKVGEYDSYICSIIPEDIFKVLTDLRFFSEKMPWKERREVLLNIAGEVGTPFGFDELLGKLNGRTVDEYRTVLAAQKKRLAQEREEINPRIDEITKGLEMYAGTDKGKLEQSRKAIESALRVITVKRTALLASEKERQEIQDKINILERKKIQREGELKNDTSSIQTLLDEKSTISKTYGEKCNALNIIRDNIESKKVQLKGLQTIMDAHTETLNQIREDAQAAANKPSDTTCYACGQQLPADKIEKAEKVRKTALAEITSRGNEVKNSIKACKEKIEGIESEIQKMQAGFDGLDEAEKQLKEYEVESAKRLEVINAKIKSNPTISPNQDKNWRGLCNEIKRLTEQLGPPLSKQLEEIEDARIAKEKELADINTSLAQADRNKRDHGRITELSNREKELGQQINDIDRQLSSIEEYTMMQSDMIETAVNDKFRYVKFKMFDQLLNEGVRECCEATFNGVPYADMSAGQQIFAGVDIVNILSGHYDTSVPLFIDHSESLTSPVESNTQLIELYAQKGISGLQVLLNMSH